MAFDVELETKLRPPALEMAPYPSKIITLANGKKMIVRQARRKEVPVPSEAIHPTLFIPRDFYDLVGARLYTELLGWYRFRVRNETILCIETTIGGRRPRYPRSYEWPQIQKS